VQLRESIDIEEDKVQTVAHNIVTHYGEFLRKYLKTNKPEHAEDILQDFYLSIVIQPQALPNFLTKSYFKRALRNDIIDNERKKKAYKMFLYRYKHFVENTLGREQDVQKTTKYIFIREDVRYIYKLAKRKLPVHLYRALVLRYRRQYSIQTISEMLNVDTNVVRVYISTALRKVREVVLINDNIEGCPTQKLI